jgi:hypothetical protein
MDWMVETEGIELAAPHAVFETSLLHINGDFQSGAPESAQLPKIPILVAPLR